MDNGILTPGFLSRAERYQASLSDPDSATAETIAAMVFDIQRSKTDPLLQRYALEAVKAWGLPLTFDAFQDSSAIAWSVYWFAKHSLRFEHHQKQIWVWFREQDQLQLLIEPSVLVRMDQWKGDCAIYTMLICAMLEVFQVPWEIVTIACDRRQPGIFTHVFPRVILPDGRRETLDASHGIGPGWQVPSRDTFRLQVWDSAGNAIEDAQPAKFDGLHGYVAAAPWGWGVSGFYKRPGFGSWSGLGCGCSQLDDSGNCLDPDPCTPPADTGSVFTCPAGETEVNGVCTAPSSCPSGMSLVGGVCTETSCPSGMTLSGGVCVDAATGGYVAPSGGTSTAAWAAFAAQLAKSGMTLAEINAIQPGTVVGANGTIIRQAPGYPVSATGTSIATALGGSSSGILLLVVGLGLVLALKR